MTKEEIEKIVAKIKEGASSEEEENLILEVLSKSAVDLNNFIKNTLTEKSKE